MSQQPEPPLAPRARLRWSVVSRLVTELEPAEILELGCGLGGVGVRLAAMAPYTAAEPDDECFQVAHDRISPLGGTVLHGDHNKVPDGSTYDLVCAFEVLEHIADDVAALAEWVPLVKPGGHILLSVPANPERFGPSDVAAGHYRRYTSDELAGKLADAGCVDVKVRHYAWPLGYLLDDVRDWLVNRRAPRDASAAPEENTAGSGRLFQPQSRVTGTLIRAGVAPFGVLQNLQPGRGPGLVALARRPAAS